MPLAIEQQEDQGIWLPDGRTLGGVRFILKPSDVERLRTGYACAKCFQVFERPWPERCEVCGVNVRRDQAAYFAREFDGEVDLSPSWTVQSELEQLDERRRKEEERQAKEAKAR